MMSAWIKGSLLAVATFVLCWGGAVGYWRVTNRMPSPSDLALYLLALPLALLALVWLGRKVLARSAAPALASAPAVAATAPALGPALALLAAALRTPHGASPEELAGALASQRARPDLDPDLLDDEGYPIMSARVTDAFDADLREHIESWFRANREEPVRLQDEQWRALGMATSVATELAHHAAAHPHALPAEGAPRPPMLQVALLLSPTWDDAQRSAAASWIGHVVGEAGWPAARISASAMRQGAPSAAAAACLIEWTASAAAATDPVLAMLIACDSQIGEASIDRLSGAGKLMVASRPQGVIPGEGAAGLLLSDLRQSALMGITAPSLHAVSALRDGSADVAGKPDAAVLRSLAGHACEQGALDPAGVTMVTADSGHRTSRVMELMALATEAMPHLDAGTDVQAVGTACGDCGAVPILAALALACHHAVERGAPILCVSNEDPLHRSAVLVRPPALPS